jgi:hypothetical protein
MSENSVMTNEQALSELRELIKDYHTYNTKEKEFKNLKDPLNKKIKEIMKNHNLQEFEADDLVAAYSETEKVSMNEERLLRKLKELGLEEAIETIERPNQSVVEQLIYDGKLDPAAIADCVETSVVATLRIKKLKGKK